MRLRLKRNSSGPKAVPIYFNRYHLLINRVESTVQIRPKLLDSIKSKSGDSLLYKPPSSLPACQNWSVAETIVLQEKLQRSIQVQIWRLFAVQASVLLSNLEKLVNSKDERPTRKFVYMAVSLTTTSPFRQKLGNNSWPKNNTPQSTLSFLNSKPFSANRHGTRMPQIVWPNTLT